MSGIYKLKKEARKKINLIVKNFYICLRQFHMEYLEFELPIKELHDQLEKCDSIGAENDIDVSETCDSN